MQFKVMRSEGRSIAVIYKFKEEDEDFFYKWNIVGAFQIVIETKELGKFGVKKLFAVKQSFTTPSPTVLVACKSFAEAEVEMNKAIERIIFAYAV